VAIGVAVAIMARIRRWLRDQQAFCILIALAIVSIPIMIWAPEWMVNAYRHGPNERPLTLGEFTSAVNEYRKTIAQAIAGVVGFYALWLLHKRTKATEGTLTATREDLQITKEGQVTERFTRAIDQLGAVHSDGTPNIEIRLGGIYALERIAKDSQRDHGTIMEILTAYVRKNAAWNPGNTADTPNQDKTLSGPRPDIQAILTVIGRRNVKFDSDCIIDLSCTDLRIVKLSHAYLEHVSLTGAHLEEAQLVGTHMQYADLGRAHLESANLGGAHLDGAKLNEANLQKANLSMARLEGAILYDAHLENAYLREAHLECANLSHAYLHNADLGYAHLESASFQGAHLNNADLCGSRLDGANFGIAHLNGANLRLATGLTTDQIKAARDWEFAEYDPGFRTALTGC
jgi:uncharacterized protein YjbI with pentapeptide repeats